MGLIEGFSGAPPHPNIPAPLNVNSAIVSEDIGWIDLQLTNVVLLGVSARIADEQSRPAQGTFRYFCSSASLVSGWPLQMNPPVAPQHFNPIGLV